MGNKGGMVLGTYSRVGHLPHKEAGHDGAGDPGDSHAGPGEAPASHLGVSGKIAGGGVRTPPGGRRWRARSRENFPEADSKQFSTEDTQMANRHVKNHA